MFDTFAEEYKMTIGALKAARIKLKTVYASHLFNALSTLLHSHKASRVLTVRTKIKLPLLLSLA